MLQISFSTARETTFEEAKLQFEVALMEASGEDRSQQLCSNSVNLLTIQLHHSPYG